jgi:hypothetical protein
MSWRRVFWATDFRQIFCNSARLSVVAVVMILLSATRVDAGEHFSYRVEAAGRPLIVTDDAGAAIAVLREVGVDDPQRIIAHARSWGMVEIVEPAHQ